MPCGVQHTLLLLNLLLPTHHSYLLLVSITYYHHYVLLYLKETWGWEFASYSRQAYNVNGMKEWMHTSYSEIDERNKHWHLVQCIVVALEGCMEELKEWVKIQT